MDAQKSRIRTILTITAAFLALLFFQTAASKAASLLAGLINYKVIDPYNVFACVSVHHILQMIFALIVMVVLIKLYHYDFHLRFKKSKAGIKYTVIFMAVITVCVVLAFVIEHFMGITYTYSYPLNAYNMTGFLGFQLFLSGPSEEILFRALPLTLFLRIYKDEKKVVVPLVLTSLLFSIAHIGWGLSPFYISFDWFQLIYCFIYGILYGIAYIKSKSVLYPMILHSFSNIVMIGGGYIYTLLF